MEVTAMSEKDKNTTLFWVLLIKRNFGNTILVSALGAIEALTFVGIRHENTKNMILGINPTINPEFITYFALLFGVAIALIYSFAITIQKLLIHEYNNLSGKKHPDLSIVITVAMGLVIFLYMTEKDDTIIDQTSLTTQILGNTAKYLVPALLVSVFSLLSFYSNMVLALRLEKSEPMKKIDAFLNRKIEADIASDFEEEGASLQDLIKQKYKNLNK